MSVAKLIELADVLADINFGTENTEVISQRTLSFFCFPSLNLSATTNFGTKHTAVTELVEVILFQRAHGVFFLRELRA